MSKLSTFTAKTTPVATDLVYIASAADSYAERQTTIAGFLTSQTLTTCTLNSPTLVTPVLGVATATSLNKVAVTAPASSATLTIANLKTFTVSNTLTLAGTDGTTMTFPSTSGTVVTLDATQTLTNKTFTSPTFNSPTLVTPNLGVATATSVNGLTIAATTGTLTIANGGELKTTGAYQINFTATAATAVTLPTSGTLATLTGTETLTNKTLTAPVIGAATGTSLSVTGAFTARSGTTTPAAASAVAALLFGSDNVGLYWGTGDPTTGNPVAVQGSLYVRTDGSAVNNRVWIKTAASWTYFTTGA